MLPTRFALSAIIIAILAACAAPTPYKAATIRDGFSETRIEDDRFRVTFRGNSRTKRETVEIYLLHRAAEVALENGGDWFEVVDRELDADSQVIVHGDPFFSPFGGWPHVHPRSHRRFRSAVFYNPFPTTASTIRRYEATAEILVRQGEKPGDDPLAYDARQIIDNLGPKLVREVVG